MCQKQMMNVEHSFKENKLPGLKNIIASDIDGQSNIIDENGKGPDIQLS